MVSNLFCLGDFVLESKIEGHTLEERVFFLPDGLYRPGIRAGQFLLIEHGGLWPSSPAWQSHFVIDISEGSL